jgi:hypothetical protein
MITKLFLAGYDAKARPAVTASALLGERELTAVDRCHGLCGALLASGRDYALLSKRFRVPHLIFGGCGRCAPLFPASAKSFYIATCNRRVT